MPVGGTVTAGGGSAIPVGGTGVATVGDVRPEGDEYGIGSTALDAEPERVAGSVGADPGARRTACPSFTPAVGAGMAWPAGATAEDPIAWAGAASTGAGRTRAGD